MYSFQLSDHYFLEIDHICKPFEGINPLNVSFSTLKSPKAMLKPSNIPLNPLIISLKPLNYGQFRLFLPISYTTVFLSVVHDLDTCFFAWITYCCQTFFSLITVIYTLAAVDNAIVAITSPVQTCSTADFPFKDKGKLYRQVRVKTEETQNSLEMLVIRLGRSL